MNCYDLVKGMLNIHILVLGNVQNDHTAPFNELQL